MEKLKKEELKDKFFSNTLFSEMSLTKETIDSLSKEGYTTATEVQLKTIPIAQKGKDILCTAKTGSGKTLSFIIPSMEMLIRTNFSQKQGVGIIVITPTRELAFQIYSISKKLLFNIKKTCGLIIGGGYRKKESKQLIKGINLLIATPGRLLDHLNSTEGFSCNNLCMLIIDEADMILKNGFEDELKEILNKIPKERQTLLFSATLNQKVENLNTLSLTNPVYIKIQSKLNQSPTLSNLEQGFIKLSGDIKFLFLYTFIKKNKSKKIMIFFNSCKEVEFYNDLLNYVGIKVKSIHGDLKQSIREEIYKNFFDIEKGILLCTDIAQRGLDFPQVDWIINYDLPLSPNEYLHRVGRTARGPNSFGKSLLILMDNEMDMLKRLKDRNIILKEYEFDKSKIIDIQDKFETLINSNPAFENLAQDAYKSYIFSYMYSKINNVDNLENIEKLDKEKVVKSFGLRKVPFIKIKKFNK